MAYVERIGWSVERAEHILTRSARYLGAMDIEPEWTAEAVADVERLVAEPDPKSVHANAVRILGWSASAGAVLTVVALRRPDGTLAGATAWKATGAERRAYEEAKHDRGE